MATDALTRNRRRFSIPAAAALGGALAGMGLLVAVGNNGGTSADSTMSDVTTTVPAPTSAAPAPAPAPTTASRPSSDGIGAQEAGPIAAAHVGGTVDTVTAETDYGAAWDIDVYAPNGEYTIYVSSSGAIVRVEGPFTD